MADKLLVVLKRSENSGFGFSLLGSTGPPHVIYDIVENSPAAECGEVEAGDIIVKVNGVDVHRYTTKEVLKCLRLSDDLVTLELKRDPKLKAHIKEHLAKTSNLHYSDVETNKNNIYDVKSPRKIDSLSLSPSSSVTSNQIISNSITVTTNIITGTTTTATSSSSLTKSQQNSQNHNRINSESICRPSRIPQAVRSPPPKSVPQSPYNKKTKLSHLPTINTTLTTTTITTATNTINNGTNNFTNYNQDQYQYSTSHHHHYQQQQQQQQQSTSAPPIGKARFEAFMMTGDLILNLSRTPQSNNLIASQAKKVDSLRDSPQRSIQQSNGAIAPRASGESTPSSSSPTQSQSSDSNNSIRNKKKDSEYYTLSTTTDRIFERELTVDDEEIEEEEEEEREIQTEEEEKLKLPTETILGVSSQDRDDNYYQKNIKSERKTTRVGGGGDVEQQYQQQQQSLIYDGSNIASSDFNACISSSSSSISKKK